MRNGICHFKVETIPDNSGEITSLRIKDNGNFKVELSVSQLKEFITSLGNHVLSN
jgi:hypothetical protein